MEQNTTSHSTPKSTSTSNVGIKRGYTTQETNEAEAEAPIGKKAKIDGSQDVHDVYIGWLSEEPLIKVFARVISNVVSHVRPLNAKEAEELPPYLRDRWSKLVPQNGRIKLDKVTLDEELFRVQSKGLERTSKIKLIKNLVESRSCGEAGDTIGKSDVLGPQTSTTHTSRGEIGVKTESIYDDTEIHKPSLARWTFQEFSLLESFTNTQLELEREDESRYITWTKHWDNASAKLRKLGYNRSATACQQRVRYKFHCALIRSTRNFCATAVSTLPHLVRRTRLIT